MNIARGGYTSITSSPYRDINKAKFMPTRRTSRIKAYSPASGNNCPNMGQRRIELVHYSPIWRKHAQARTSRTHKTRPTSVAGFLREPTPIVSGC